MQRLYTAKDKKAVLWSRHRAAAVENKCQFAIKILIVGHQSTHNHIGVPAEVLGDGMHYDVGAEVKRILQVGRRERIINGNADIVFLRDLNTSSDVNNIHQWIRRRLKPEQFCVFVDIGNDVFCMRQIEKVKLDPEPFIYSSEHPIGSAVEVVAGNDFISRRE